MQREPTFPMRRRATRRIRVGTVDIGGGAPVSVQTMTKTDTRDVGATVAQIREVADAGCDIVRVAVVDREAADALRPICEASPIPVIADIHFQAELALAAIEAGVAGLRINPGNIGSQDRIRTVVDAARARGAPIRIGVNAGSLEKDIEARYGNGAEALVESALRHVALLESYDFQAIKISVKASDVARTVQAYRMLAQRTDYPLHLGVTEAGTFLAGTVRSCVGMGVLLAEGIGDTIRVSLTDTPAREVRVGLELLRSLGLREPGPSVVSCPTCGRVQVDVAAVAAAVERDLERFYRAHPDAPRPTVAVMGCMVNGPGEARHADIALAGGRHQFALYRAGQLVRTVPETNAVDAVLDLVRGWASMPQGHASP